MTPGPSACGAPGRSSPCSGRSRDLGEPRGSRRVSDTREGQPRGGDTRPCVQLHLLLGEAVERDRGRGLWERADPAVGSGIGADPCPGERPRPLDLRARPGTAHRQGTEGTGCPTRCHTWNHTWNHTEHPTLTSCPTSQPASHLASHPEIPPWHPTPVSHPAPRHCHLRGVPMVPPLSWQLLSGAEDSFVHVWQLSRDPDTDGIEVSPGLAHGPGARSHGCSVGTGDVGQGCGPWSCGCRRSLGVPYGSAPATDPALPRRVRDGHAGLRRSLL